MRELNNKQLEKKQVEIGTPEQARKYLDMANSHMTKSRAFERQANTLESQIQRKIQPASRMSEVSSLRRKAEAEKREADRYNSYARMEMRTSYNAEMTDEISGFTGKSIGEVSNTTEVKDGDTVKTVDETIGLEDAFKNAENTLKDIIKGTASEKVSSVEQKLELSESEQKNFDEIDSMTESQISFDRIVGYKRGACSGEQIPIYD